MQACNKPNKEKLKVQSILERKYSLEMGSKIPFSISFAGLCSEAEILQDLNLHN